MLCYKNIEKVLCVFLILLFSDHSFGQELPPIEIFTPQDYGADNQNWSISQDANETIYIANNKGLLEYNGTRWKLYPSSNETILRSVAVIDEKIYTGSYMDFGFWQRNPFGLLEYTSLVSNLEEELIQDEEFWNITFLEDWILFQSLDRIYIFNIKSKKFRIINSDSRIIKMYKVDDAIYFQKNGMGLYKFENGSTILLSDDPIIKENELVNVFKYKDITLVQTKENGFFTFSNNVVDKWEISANNLLTNVSVYSSIRLKNGNFILGTISNGIIKLDVNGDVLFTMDQNYGLTNNTVLSLFEDVSGNIWLGTDNGVNALNLNSPYRVYRDNQGDLGTIYASAKTNNYLYIGTNQGLFYRPLVSNKQFSLVKGTEGQVWSLNKIDDFLFCGHDKGTFQITDINAVMISEEKGTWDIKKIKGRPNLLIQGNYKGLSILELSNSNQWVFRNKLIGFDISSRYFNFLNSTELLISHEYKGVYRLKLNSDYTTVLDYNKEDIDKGIGSSIINYNDDLYYVYKDGVFKYDSIETKFKKDNLFNGLFTHENYVSGKLVSDIEKNRLWGFFVHQVVYIEPGKLSDQPKINTIDLPSSLRKNKSGFENMLHLNDETYLMGTTEGFLVIDINRFIDRKYKITLNEAGLSSLQEEKIPLIIKEKANLKTKDNNLYFSYSTPDFNKLTPSLYQYRLLGVYNEWSNWSERSEVNFKNLPHGDYIFEVRAKVGDNLSINTAKFLFNIHKPWYLSLLAKIFYVLLLIVLASTIQFLNTRYYKKQRKKLLASKEREIEFKELENQRQLMAFNNESLKQDIESKNRELGLSTMNLIRKNEFLNDLKKELNNSNKSEDLKRVIKIIDKNINNTEDWKFFEQAFNNADKDFLKKIKSIHPLLTPNDLKLCAYLRLNLSSKEIAPLLNISHRSVEVKRYRLRKKMNLPHEASLTNYILEI